MAECCNTQGLKCLITGWQYCGVRQQVVGIRLRPRRAWSTCRTLHHALFKLPFLPSRLPSTVSACASRCDRLESAWQLPWVKHFLVQQESSELARSTCMRCCLSLLMVKSRNDQCSIKTAEDKRLQKKDALTARPVEPATTTGWKQGPNTGSGLSFLVLWLHEVWRHVFCDSSQEEGYVAVSRHTYVADLSRRPPSEERLVVGGGGGSQREWL